MVVCSRCGMHQYLQTLQWCTLEGEVVSEPNSTDPAHHWCENCETHPDFIKVEEPIYLEGRCKFHAVAKKGVLLEQLLPIEESVSEMDRLSGSLTHVPSLERLEPFIKKAEIKVIEVHQMEANL